MRFGLGRYSWCDGIIDRGDGAGGSNLPSPPASSAESPSEPLPGGSEPFKSDLAALLSFATCESYALWVL
jgi:hypothetical protein